MRESPTATLFKHKLRASFIHNIINGGMDEHGTLGMRGFRDLPKQSKEKIVNLIIQLTQSLKANEVMKKTLNDQKGMYEKRIGELKLRNDDIIHEMVNMKQKVTQSFKIIQEYQSRLESALKTNEEYASVLQEAQSRVKELEDRVWTNVSDFSFATHKTNGAITPSPKKVEPLSSSKEIDKSEGWSDRLSQYLSKHSKSETSMSTAIDDRDDITELLQMENGMEKEVNEDDDILSIMKLLEDID